MDRIKFRAMHYAVDNISLDCIFPTKLSLQKPLTADKVSKTCNIILLPYGSKFHVIKIFLKGMISVTVK